MFFKKQKSPEQVTVINNSEFILQLEQTVRSIGASPSSVDGVLMALLIMKGVVTTSEANDIQFHFKSKNYKLN